MMRKKPIIGVIDGQGGGIGSQIIKKLREGLSSEQEIVALGTNAVATAAMMKAKANRGASGENAILVSLPEIDVLIGALSIVLANSMMGEITPTISSAIASSCADKILLPLRVPGLEITGYVYQPFPHLIDDAIIKVKAKLEIIK